MKYCILLLLLFAAGYTTYAQTELTKANNCYTSKEYQCALDNYLVVLSNKTYKEEDKGLVEYRAGYCYSKLFNDNKALEYYHKSAVTKPDYVYAYWGVADAYNNLGKNKDAIEYYKKAAGLATLPADKENISFALAEVYYEMTQYSNALTEYRKINSRTGGFYVVDSYMADAFFYMAKYDSALVYYQKALPNYKKEDITFKKIHLFIGKCYRLTGKKELAERAFDEAIAADSKYGAAYWEKGIIYATNENYATAIDLYKKALSYLSATDTADNYTLCGNIMACYQKQKNYTEEMNWLIKRRQYSKVKYNETAGIAVIQYGRLKKIADAEKTCKDAINSYQIEPEAVRKANEYSYVKLNGIAGRIALEKKDTAKAKQYFEEALKINKYAYDGNAGAAEIAWNRGDKNACKNYFYNISKSGYDAVLNSKKDIANVYARSAYIAAYEDKKASTYYASDVTTALSFDSTQKEAVLLWPIILHNNKYDLERNRNTCLQVLQKAVTMYAADKEYVSELYNSKAVLTVQTDTVAVRKALEEAVKIFPVNVNAWNNLLKYYSNYDNAKGAAMVDKLIDVLKKQKDNTALAVAYVYKGDFFWRLEKKDAAKKAYQEALVWDANNATAKDRAKLQ